MRELIHEIAKVTLNQGGAPEPPVETAIEPYYTNLNAWDPGMCVLLCPQEILTHPKFGRK